MVGVVDVRAHAEHRRMSITPTKQLFFAWSSNWLTCEESRARQRLQPRADAKIPNMRYNDVDSYVC